jgi:broad specificity phosphatase PhoE
MSKIFLVRHAKPAATWGQAVDPGLDELGREQADHTARRLRDTLPAMAIFSSPLKRCAETAAPLAELWATTAVTMPAVAEVPSPPLGVAERAQWLAAGMQGTWSQLQASCPAGAPDYALWRKMLLESLQALQTDCVIYSHYIAINVVIGAALQNDRVINFRPGHASITEIDVRNGRFEIRQLGREADGGVLLGK